MFVFLQSVGWNIFVLILRRSSVCVLTARVVMGDTHRKRLKQYVHGFLGCHMTQQRTKLGKHSCYHTQETEMYEATELCWTIRKYKTSKKEITLFEG